MSNTNITGFLSPRLLAGAALVGLVGAAGVFIYEQVYNEKRRVMLVQEVQRLDRQVNSMRTELAALKELQKETHLRRLRQKRPKRERKPQAMASGDTVDAPDVSYASDSEYFTDYQSVVGTDHDMDSEEFYDVHTDDDDDTICGDLPQNGHITLVDQLDEDGSGSPKLSPANKT